MGHRGSRNMVTYAVSSALLALLAVTGAFGSGVFVQNDTPIVVVRVDDCMVSWRTPRESLGGVSPYQYAKNHDIAITWAIITSWPDTGRSLTWTEFREYLDACGGEAASHSHNHTNPASDADAIYELTHSKEVIEANLPGYTCTSFVQPGPWSSYYLDRFYKLDWPVFQQMQSIYERSLAYLAVGWIVGDAPYPHGLTYLAPLDRRPGWTISSLDNRLDIIAETPGVVAVFQLHQVEADSGSDQYAAPETIYKEFIDKLSQLRDQAAIQIKSLREAYTRSASADLNHMPDPGFEKCVLNAHTIGPWFSGGDASIVDTGGYPDNKRYCRVLSDNAWVKSADTLLKPGRYEVKWWQKTEPGYPLQVLGVLIMNDGPGVSRVATINPNYVNSAVDVWEQKTALALIADEFPRACVRFKPWPGGGCGVDNVSIVYAPLQEDVSCTQTTLTRLPNQCKVRWRTPNDPSVVSVAIRYHDRKHPTTTSEGTLLGTVPVGPQDRGAYQELSVPFDWSGKIRLYFSVFAVRNDSSFAPPDLAYWFAPPTVTVNSATVTGAHSVRGQWTGADPYSTIVDYEYCVGTSPGSSNKAGPFHTNSGTITSATVSNVELEDPLYFSVRARNYSVWSDWASKRITFGGPGSAKQQSNGTSVTVAGVITAKFPDYYYIESADRGSGIKVLGTTGHSEGDEVVVYGTISLPPDSGERVITPQ